MQILLGFHRVKTAHARRLLCYLLFVYLFHGSRQLVVACVDGLPRLLYVEETPALLLDQATDTGLIPG